MDLCVARYAWMCFLFADTEKDKKVERPAKQKYILIYCRYVEKK